jgi:predicted dehydrogenase
MRQLIQSYRTGEMRVEDVPPPAARAGGVLVRTVRSLVSAGTERMVVDLARKSLLQKARARPDLVRKVIETARKQGVGNALRKARARLETPIPLGYSAAGVVVEVGSEVSELRVGDRVSCAGAGYANHADYNYVPRNLAARVPDGLDMDAACFATVGAIALQGVRQAAPTLGECVAVLGLGLIGQLTVQLLRANGCRVLGFDPNPARAKLAEELGAQRAVSADLESAAEGFSLGEGMDAVIVAASSESSAPLEQAGEISRLRGRVVVVGLVGMQVPRSIFYRKELDLRMSMSYGPGRYDPSFEERGFDYPIAHVRWTEQRNLAAFLELAAEGRIDVARLVTHRFPIDAALEAYELISSGREPYLGVLLEYGADDEQPLAPAPRVALATRPLAADRVGIGVIGAGSFAQGVLLPALARAGGSENVAIASAGGMTARRIGEQYGFRIATRDADEIVAHPDVHAVVVLTRHDLHAPLAARALAAGKYVFTEKPLALSLESLEAVVAARAGAPGDVMVGFNRRWAPLVAAIREHFAGRSHPLVMNYRINAGFVPHDHWLHDPVEGGGRIVGEVCHFVDLLQHLAGAPPVRVFAEPIAGDSRYRGDDNVALTLRFADGSIGSVVYTAMGDAQVAKEWLEVFGEGRVAILDDFRSLRLARDGRSRRLRSASQDKGFDEQMRRFLAAVRAGEPAPTPFEESLATTRATLAAVASLRSGAPEPV